MWVPCCVSLGHSYMELNFTDWEKCIFGGVKIDCVDDLIPAAVACILHPTMQPQNAPCCLQFGGPKAD